MGRRIEPSIHFYRVRGIKLSNLVNHLIACNLGLRQIAERLMETMEAARELPPIMQLAFRQNPRAHEEWNRMSPSHRRAHLFGIFYYRTPEARANRVEK